MKPRNSLWSFEACFCGEPFCLRILSMVTLLLEIRWNPYYWFGFITTSWLSLAHRFHFQLPSYGCYPSLCSFTSDFLSGHSIATIVDDCHVSPEAFSSGVCQGSAPPPALFLLFHTKFVWLLVPSSHMLMASLFTILRFLSTNPANNNSPNRG